MSRLFDNIKSSMHICNECHGTGEMVTDIGEVSCCSLCFGEGEIPRYIHNNIQKDKQDHCNLENPLNE